MRFEDLARQSVDALREVAKQSVRPVAELLAPRRQLLVTPLVAATMGLLVLAAVGLPAWLQRREPPPDPGSHQSSRMFAPPFEIESGIHRYTVQLPNGEWVTLSLPGSIAGEVAGFVPGATVGPSPESAHPLEVVYGTVKSVFADAELVETLTDATGEPVLRYRAEAGWQFSAVQYGPWVVLFYEEGDVSVAVTPLANLSGSVTEDGFLLLRPRAGMSFQPPHSSPDAAFLSASGETLLWLWHPHAGSCEGDEVGRLRLDEGPDVTTLCDPATGDALFVANAAGFPRDDMSRIDFHVGPHPTTPTVPPDTR